MPKVTFLLIFTLTVFSCDLVDGGRSFSEESSMPSQARVLPQSDYIFDMGDVPHIDIMISIHEWNTLLTNYDTFWKNEENVHADFVFEKNGLSRTNLNIGFRIRGNTSRRRPEGDNPENGMSHTPGILHQQGTTYYHSAHFRLDFNEYDGESHFYGYKNLILKWFKDDPNYVREIYSYDLFRRFGVWNAPRASYTRLTINFKETGEQAYYGVYEMLEAVDKSYLKAHYTNNHKGFLWKCSAGATLDLGSESQAGLEIESPTSKYTPYYDLKTRKEDFTNSAKPLLLEFMQGLNTLSDASPELEAWLDQHFEVDLFLRTMAVTIMIGSWDSYWNGGANYYLYFDEQGKASYIPYDFDNTLGTGLNAFGNPATSDISQWVNTSLPLVKKVLSVSAHYQTLMQYLQELMEPGRELFDISSSTNRISSWRSMIIPYMSGIDVAPDGQNNYNSFSDLPAQTWGDFRHFQLFSGDASGTGDSGPGANFFKSRALSASQQMGINPPDWTGPVAYEANYDEVYIRGSFGGWSDGQALSLVGHHTWQISLNGLSGTTEYKFTTHASDWGELNWGDPGHDGRADAWSSVNMSTSLEGNVVFTFRDDDLSYTTSN